MPRTQAFDSAAVARSARGVFWRHGFTATSIPALEEATGINRSSIYNAFGSKQGLFEAAVKSYLDEVVRPRLAPLQADVVAPGALVAYLEGLMAAFDQEGSLPATAGCLLVNSGTSDVADDPVVAGQIRAYRQELGTAFARGVAAARPELPEHVAREVAEAVTGLVVAGFASVRVDRVPALSALRAARGLAGAVWPAGRRDADGRSAPDPHADLAEAADGPL